MSLLQNDIDCSAQDGFSLKFFKHFCHNLYSAKNFQGFHFLDHYDNDCFLFLKSLTKNTLKNNE